MKTKSTAFSVALTDLIDRRYEGNRTALSRQCGIPAPTLYTLCTAKVKPSMRRLEVIADVLGKDDRQMLLLAAAQDVIPAKYKHEVADAGGAFGRPKLAADLEAVVCFLEDEAAAEPEVAGMLRSIGRWAGVLPDDGHLGMVAEDVLRYEAHDDAGGAAV